MYDIKIIKDSIAQNGIRLTTFELTYPLIIHAEVMTHRVFSRNVASNRAIPVEKMTMSVSHNPFIPEQFPKNKSGMQNEEWLTGTDEKLARQFWVEASKYAIGYAEALKNLNVHKQITNRLLAPFLWTTAVITATDWTNFFDLRCHEMAQPEIQKVAYPMRDLYDSSEPVFLDYGEWHLPYISEPFTFDLPDAIAISIGRCARISYLRHGENNTPEKDIELAERLIASKHMSPTEHVATPLMEKGYCNNFRGWMQYRHLIEDYKP